MHYNMSSLLVATGAGITLSLLASSALAERTVTVVSWGGAYTEAQTKALYEPFEQATGIKVISVDYNGGLGQIKAQVEAGKVTWDVVQIEAGDPVIGCEEGLLEEIDPAWLSPAADGTPGGEDFIDGGLLPCAAGTIVWSTVIAYNDEAFPDAKPQRIEDFFDLENFPGKRALRKTPLINLEWALMADGVPLDEIYPTLETEEGVARAFAKLDTIKEQVIWWEAGAQPPQMLADGEVVMASAYNGRIFNAQANEKQPFKIIWNGQILAMDMWAVPRGTPHLEEAKAFLNYATAPENSARISEYIAYGSPRASAAAYQPVNAENGIEMASHLPTYPANMQNALRNDIEFWTDYQNELDDRFSSWLLQ